MMIQIFTNKTGDVLVPTVVQTEAGYWLGIEPVEHASWHDLSSVLEAVRKTAARSGQIIPTPSRTNFPKPAVLPHANAKTLSEFERKYELTSIFQSSDGGFSVERYRKAPEGLGGITDSNTSTTYPAGTSLDEVVVTVAHTIKLKTK